MRPKNVGICSVPGPSKNVLHRYTRPWNNQLRWYAPPSTKFVAPKHGNRGPQPDPWLEERFNVLDPRLNRNSQNTSPSQRRGKFSNILTKLFAVVGSLYLGYHAFGIGLHYYVMSQAPTIESVEGLLSQSEAVRILIEQGFVEVENGAHNVTKERTPHGTMIKRTYMSSDKDQVVVLFGFDRGTIGIRIQGPYSHRFMTSSMDGMKTLANQYFELPDGVYQVSSHSIDMTHLEYQRGIFAVTISPLWLIEGSHRERAESTHKLFYRGDPFKTPENDGDPSFYLHHRMFEGQQKTFKEAGSRIGKCHLPQAMWRGRTTNDEKTVKDPFDPPSLERTVAPGSESSPSTTLTSSESG